MVEIVFLILACVMGVLLAGMFAGCETGTYQLSRFRLRVGIEQKRLWFSTLGKAMRDTSGLIFSLLIGTNLSHYLVTSMVTYMIVQHAGVTGGAEFYATCIMTPVLFVFAELIPKNLFYYRADSLMPYFAPIIWLNRKILTWCQVVPLLKIISRGFVRLTGFSGADNTAITKAQKHHIKGIIQDTHEEAILSPIQSDMINRMANISHIAIGTVMVPMNKIEMAEENDDVAALLSKLRRADFTRLLVYSKTTDNVIGFINIYEVLNAEDSFKSLAEFIKPIRKISSHTSVIDAINIMQQEKHKIILVVKSKGWSPEKCVGIVTMKDLVEELVGELVEW